MAYDGTLEDGVRVDRLLRLSEIIARNPDTYDHDTFGRKTLLGIVGCAFAQACIHMGEEIGFQYDVRLSRDLYFPEMIDERDGVDVMLLCIGAPGSEQREVQEAEFYARIGAPFGLTTLQSKSIFGDSDEDVVMAFYGHDFSAENVSRRIRNFALQATGAVRVGRA